MWFHAPFRADEWLLFDVKSVKMAGGRGFNMGYLYNSSGELVISTTQEALIRLKPIGDNAFEKVVTAAPKEAGNQ